MNPYLDLHGVLARESEELQLAVRKKLIWAYSWAIPNESAGEILREHSPWIEIGAGSGYWSWIGALRGADMLAFDRNPHAPPHWHPVQEGGPDSLLSYPDRNLLLCWPPLDEPMAADCLDRFVSRSSARYCLYIGEWEGRTADARFHDLLKSSFRIVENRKIPTWPGFRDELYLLRKN